MDSQEPSQSSYSRRQAHLQKASNAKRAKREEHLSMMANIRASKKVSIESFHGMYRRQAERYKMVENRKQVFMLTWNFSQVILEAMRPVPEDAEEYDFREDPAYFGEDGEDEE
ncbi:hypothetical protein Ddc_16548 [Ditylenchus destructor]|nr:hypothetical protein Ddc_16548 [Ditylenchus destructor]